MRRLGYGIVVLACCGVSPATARQDVSSGALTAKPRAPLVRLQSLQPVAAGGRVEKTARIGRNFTMRVDVANAGARDRLHQRVVGSMIDFYPAGETGFHLSAGTRLYDARPSGPGEAATRGLLPSQRRTNIPGPRVGMRPTPAMTMGYTGALDRDTSLGLELGAMQGRAYATGEDMARRTRADRDHGGRGPVNPMVNLVVGHRF